jgi:hypothetical protein
MQEQKYRIDVLDGTGRLVNKQTGVPIPDDEPVFIFRAKDKYALAILVGYQIVCANLEHKALINKSIQAFRDFANANPELMKEPDA